MELEAFDSENGAINHIENMTHVYADEVDHNWLYNYDKVKILKTADN